MTRAVFVRIAGAFSLYQNGVAAGPPTASFSTTKIGENTWAFDASASSTSTGTLTNWAWNYGDGTSGAGKTASHAYTSAGTFTITLTVTNSTGVSGQTSSAVTATSPFILGVTKPDATNTGVGIVRPAPTGSAGTIGTTTVATNTTLQGYTVNGDVTLLAGAKLMDCIVNGLVQVKAGASLIENNIIRGNATDYDSYALGGMITCNVNGAGYAKTKIQFNEVYSQVATRAMNGISFRNFSAYRNNVHDIVDGIDYAPFQAAKGTSTYDPNVDIQGNYIHDLILTVPDYNRSQTHNDCIQGHGGGPGTLIRGNNLDARYSSLSTSQPTTWGFLSCVMINDDYGIPKLTVDKNWISGGATPINAQGSGDAQLTLTNNIFDISTIQGWAGWILNSAIAGCTITGNVTNTGLTVAVGPGGSNYTIHTSVS